MVAGSRVHADSVWSISNSQGRKGPESNLRLNSGKRISWGSDHVRDRLVWDAE